MCLLCCEDHALQFTSEDGDLVSVFTGMPVADDPDGAGVETPAAGGGVETPLLPQATVSEGGDVAASISTTAVMSVGDRFDGSIGSSGTDRDWIRIELTAGESYVFSSWGTGGTAAGINDTLLNLRDANGSLVTSNDDVVSQSNLFSQITYTATSSGTFYLDVGSWSDTETGSYSVSVSTDTFSVEEIATQLTEFGWGVPTTLRHNESTGDTMTVNITGLTSEGQQLALWALESWTNVTGISFTTTSGSADITFDDNQSGAFAGPDAYNPNTGEISSASVNVSTSWLASYGTTLDSYSYQTYVHEIGHALGLYHSGNYNGSATYGVDNHFLNDSYQMTVMSYFSISENTNVDASNYLLAGPMLADIYAIQSLYGTPTNVFSGDTVWGRNSNVGGIQGTLMGYLFDGDSVNASIYGGGMLAMTIYDSGGTDLIDVSGRSDHQYLDLREGRFSNVAGLTGNLGVAIGAVIENGTTGSGNDTLIGNASDNVLTGGTGNDSIDGNAGTDTLVINAARSGATVNDLGGGVYEVVTSDGTDRFTNVEFFQFTDGTVDLATLLSEEPGGGSGGPGDTITGTGQNDSLTGTAGDDLLSGLGGYDTLLGQGGNDVLYGGDRRDRLMGGDGDDTLHGELGADWLYGEDGNDSLLGGDSQDFLYGGAGDDTLDAGEAADRVYGGTGHDLIYGGINRGLSRDGLFGEEGNDTLYGGIGYDVVDGGDGNDLVDGGTNADNLYGRVGDDTLIGGQGFDRLFGGPGNDLMQGGSGTDAFYGHAGNDTMEGGSSNDRMFAGRDNDHVDGGSGNDSLVGGGGDDTLIGGSGNDTLAGRSEADVFIFTDGHGVDVIEDFEATNDAEQIDLSAVSAITDFADLMGSHATQAGGNVEIDTGSGNSITLTGVNIADLDAADFIF
jgi:serralysin